MNRGLTLKIFLNLKNYPAFGAYYSGALPSTYLIQTYGYAILYSYTGALEIAKIFYYDLKITHSGTIQTSLHFTCPIYTFWLATQHLRPQSLLFILHLATLYMYFGPLRKNHNILLTSYFICTAFLKTQFFLRFFI